MSVSSSQVKAILDVLDYIRLKEEEKKKETESYILSKRESLCSHRSQYCHNNKEENDIKTEEDAKMSKRQHYKRIGNSYESLWKFEEQYEKALLSEVYTLLDIKEHDVIVDLGGGTGMWSEKVKQDNQTCDVLLVEPCQKMIEEAVHRKNLELFLMDQNKFFETDIYFNKVIIKNCIHHFKDIKGFLDDLYEKLPEGGRAIVITLNDEGYCLPYPEMVYSYLRQLREEVDFMAQFYEKPWFSKIVHRLYPVSITPEEVKRIVKGRFTSTLSNFTDEQIAEGLEQQFKNKDSQEMVNFDFSESLLMMEKPFNIKITDEDMSHLSHKLSILGISDEVKVDQQMYDLKIKLSTMLNASS